jgi:nucleoside-diphosphate-sugar epimerase
VSTCLDRLIRWSAWIISTIFTIPGLRSRIYLPFQAGDVNATFADISKARKELDYNPSFDFREGIAEFIRWKLA